MNIQQLQYAVAIDRYKSFSKAAEACFITQATLSTMIKKLEAELNIIIFDRKTNPVITTECGKEIVEEAQKALLHIEQMKNKATESKGHILGEINLGIIPTIAGNLLHRIIPSLLDKYPKLKLNIQENTTNHIIQKLRNGELDAGVVSTPLNEKDLEEKILYYEKLMVYGLAVKKTKLFKTPKDIPKENIWLLEQDNCLTDQVINFCSLNSKKINSNLSFQPNSFESLLNIVDQMKGLTLIPELYYHDLCIEKKQNVRDFMKPFPVREISIIYYRPYAKLRLIEALSEQIHANISPLLQSSKLKNSDMLISNF
jgi:LysR family hydrogen peroxide-inducible transcriptional activator